MAFDLDDIDRSIVAALVEDSRLSVRQLAERVHISRSAAHKRFTALIESGAIKGFTAEVDREWRLSACQAHSGTHVVHAALRQVLGPSALQSGSYNKPGYLRLDFSWSEALSAETRSEIGVVAGPSGGVLRALFTSDAGALDGVSAVAARLEDEAGAERARPEPSSHDEPVRPRRWFARS